MLPDREVESQGWPSKDLTRKNKHSFYTNYRAFARPAGGPSLGEVEIADIQTDDR